MKINGITNKGIILSYLMNELKRKNNIYCNRYLKISKLINMLLKSCFYLHKGFQLLTSQTPYLYYSKYKTVQKILTKRRLIYFKTLRLTWEFPSSGLTQVQSWKRHVCSSSCPGHLNLSLHPQQYTHFYCLSAFIYATTMASLLLNL